jgi:hypothetical protein
MKNYILLMFQHQTYSKEGFQVREQVREAAEEGSRVQLPQSAEDRQEEGVHHGRGGTWSKTLIAILIVKQQLMFPFVDGFDDNAKVDDIYLSKL